MLKLLKWAVVMGALAAVAAFVPVGGRTLLERWRAAKGAADFAERGIAEVRGALGLEDGPARKAPRASHSAAARTGPRTGAARSAPVERHTDADRSALDRLLAERAR